MRSRSTLPALLLFFVGGCQVATGPSRGLGAPTPGRPETIVVPDLFRLTKDEAVAALRQAGFVGTISYDTSLCGSVVDGQIIELGEVCYQHPIPGTKTGARLPLTLRLQSENPRHGRIGDHLEWHLMPDIVGMPLAEARRAMRDAGFTEERTRIKTALEEGCAPGHVCSTYPEALERSGKNSDRVIVVGADPTAPATQPPTPTEPDKPDKPEEPEPFF